MDRPPEHEAALLTTAELIRMFTFEVSRGHFAAPGQYKVDPGSIEEDMGMSELQTDMKSEIMELVVKFCNENGLAFDSSQMKIIISVEKKTTIPNGTQLQTRLVFFTDQGCMLVPYSITLIRASTPRANA